MEELERLYNELPYFDKQKFIGRHLADAKTMALRKDEQFAKEKQALINKACEWLEPVLKIWRGYYCGGDLIRDFKKSNGGKREMRTIKFRGKITDGKWVYGYLYELPSESGNVCMILTTDNIHEDNSIKPQYHLAFTLWKDLFVIDSSTIGQFTGLLDCKGNEIYEGDILGLPEADSNGVQFRNRFARVVEWINDGFFLIDREERCGEVCKYGDRLALEISLKSKYAGIAKCLKEYGDYAVIGNVYDNPELIKD